MSESSTTQSSERERAPSVTVRTVDPARLEHAAERRRAHAGLLVLSVVFPATTFLDVLYARVGAPGSLEADLVVRAVATTYVWALAARFHFAPDMSERELRIHRYGLILWTMSAVAAMAACLGGFESLYGAGAIVLAGSLAMFPEPWKRHLAIAVPVALVYPTILLASTFVTTLTAKHVHDRHAIFWLTVFSVLIACAVVNAVAISHLGWALRREAFAEKRIGRYRLRRRLGKGGMGEVWAAKHVGLGREVALKLLDAGTGEGSVAIERFEREVRATSELSHPNTVRVYDYGVSDEGQLFYAMELLEGEHLGALARREGPLPAARAVHLVNQAARALGEAHVLGIVHRDVKVENLFVTVAGGERDFLKVLDFGVAKLVRAEDADLTKTGALAGTPSTMSPELIRGDAVGPSADVYALGAVLYFLLVGRYPFEGEARSATMLSHLADPVVPPSVRSKLEIPRDVEDIVMRCLEKEPGARFASAGALADALEACSVAGRWRPPRGVPSQPPRAVRTNDEPTQAEDAATLAGGRR